MGYPTRISRSALGPTLEDRFPAPSTKHYVSAAAMNLAWWQLAGAGGVVPVAWVLFDGATAAVLASFEAWDPDSVLLPPSVVRSSTGVYVVTYDATYPNETGQMITTSLLAADPKPQGITNLNAVASVNADKRSIAVRAFIGNTAVAVDAPILLRVY